MLLKNLNKPFWLTQYFSLYFFGNPYAGEG